MKRFFVTNCCIAVIIVTKCSIIVFAFCNTSQWIIYPTNCGKFYGEQALEDLLLNVHAVTKMEIFRPHLEEYIY